MPANTTPAIASLLAMVGVASEEELFFQAEKDTTLGIVNMQIWRALDNYRCGEKTFGEYAVKLVTEATRQAEFLAAGNTPDASWLTNYAEHAAEGQREMKAAVTQLHTLVAIRNSLLAVV